MTEFVFALFFFTYSLTLFFRPKIAFAISAGLAIMLLVIVVAQDSSQRMGLVLFMAFFGAYLCSIAFAGAGAGLLVRLISKKFGLRYGVALSLTVMGIMWFLYFLVSGLVRDRRPDNERVVGFVHENLAIKEKYPRQSYGEISDSWVQDGKFTRFEIRLDLKKPKFVIVDVVRNKGESNFAVVCINDTPASLRAAGSGICESK